MEEGHHHAIAKLWQHLRDHGLQEMAVPLLRNDVRSLEDITRLSTQISHDGISDTEMSRLLASLTQRKSEHSRGRPDLPVTQNFARRASFTMALAAAQPNNRKRALDDLDRDILARSTQPSQESRVRTYRALCAAWQVEPFPISIAFAAPGLR